MKRLLLTTLVFMLITSIGSIAQETKTKEKTTTGDKTKTKTDGTQTKVKSETSDGKDVKMKKEDDKVVIKGEGVGNQIDTAAKRVASMGNFNLDMVRQEINTNNQLFGQALAKGDSVSIVSLYHSEARIYPPNMATMNMRSEMGHMATTLPSMGIHRMELTTTDVIGGPEIVVETGTYQMSDATKVADRGKYLVVWKQENGRWRIFRDIWNSDMAPTAGR